MCTVADAAVHENVFEGVKIIVGHGGAGDVRFRDDFEQRNAGPIEIDAAVALEMKIFADILFEMSARDADARDAAFEFKVDVAASWSRACRTGLIW